jgi:hypothetical protein
MAQYLEKAQRAADKVSDPEEKKWLLEDLATVKSPNRVSVPGLAVA